MVKDEDELREELINGEYEWFDRAMDVDTKVAFYANGTARVGILEAPGTWHVMDKKMVAVILDGLDEVVLQFDDSLSVAGLYDARNLDHAVSRIRAATK